MSLLSLLCRRPRMRLTSVFSCLFILLGLIGLTTAAECAINLSRSITQLEPLKGLVFFADTAASSKNPVGREAISLEFLYCLPSDVVTGKVDGVLTYDWSSLETQLNQVKSRRHQAIVRFRYEYPRRQAAIPQYVRDLPGYNPTSATLPDDTIATEYVDWTNDEIKWFSKQFLTDFAARYDTDPRIAYVQLGFGHWSEYHIYGNPLHLGINFPSKAYQTEYVTHANSVFLKTPYSFSISAGDSNYSPGPTDVAYRANTFGLFDDSFMHETHDLDAQGKGGWNERLHNNVRYLGANVATTPLRWTRAPVGGEISYYTSADQRNFLAPEGIYGVTWAQASSKYHVTYMFANDAIKGPYATTEIFTNAGKIVGYSLEIVNITRSGDIIDVTIRNNGIAPMYHEITVNVVQVDNSTMATTEAQTTTASLLSTTEEIVTSAPENFNHLVPGNSVTISIPLSQPLLPITDIRLTSPKLYEGQYIPYAASCTASNNAVSAWQSAAGFIPVAVVALLSIF